MFLFGLFDYAITKDQTLRFQLSHDQSTSKNIGIGGWDLLERGFTSDDNNSTLRVQEAGPLGRRFFTNTRASINLPPSDSHPPFERPTPPGVHAFHRGGQHRTW